MNNVLLKKIAKSSVGVFLMTSVPTKRATVFKAKSCNALLRTLLVCISIYLI